MSAGAHLPAPTAAQIASLRAELPALEHAYAALRGGNVSLDLTRGKPAADQLSLADPLDGILAGNYLATDGTDTRNYGGGLRGLHEARALGAALLDVSPETVMAGDNSSLSLMYLYLETALLFGVRGPETAWQAEARARGGSVKFLCPSPGYDRHFAICEQLGIEMISVAMDAHGPDMDQVETLVAGDPLIKGIWCVPKHSNPTGCIYSDAVVARFADLPTRAGANFRIMWDNAYAVHDLTSTAPALASLAALAASAGTTDAVVQTTSTSKITFAGGGISFLATSEANLAAFERRLAFMTIGPDKVNQLRHVRLLPDRAAIDAHMARHAELLRPKFALVLAQLGKDLGASGLAQWREPVGGYFISLDTAPGLAKEVIRLAAELGVKITPAGATFPYSRDPNDSNIRIAPTFPPMVDLERAIKAFTLCVKLAAARRMSH